MILLKDGIIMNNDCIIFEYKGKFAHFLRAEANASAPSYPFPSRTNILGLTGAVLGLQKDSPQRLLENANFAISGRAQGTHWHTANFRKDPPGPLPKSVKKRDLGSSKAQRNTIITQEWLLYPEFTVFAQLPAPYHKEFCDRIKNKAWHFTPCLGLSEMMADLTFMDIVPLEPLDKGIHFVDSVVRKSLVILDMGKILDDGAVMKSIRMPRVVTEERAFLHESYIYEIHGKKLPVKTAHALKAGKRVIQWL